MRFSSILGAKTPKEQSDRQLRLMRIRHRLDQLTAPKFEREDVEDIMTELVTCQANIEYLLTENGEVRAQIQALLDNLRDAEIEIGKLRFEAKMANDMAKSYRQALEHQLRQERSDHVRIVTRPVLPERDKVPFQVVSDSTIKTFEDRNKKLKEVVDKLFLGVPGKETPDEPSSFLDGVEVHPDYAKAVANHPVLREIYERNGRGEQKPDEQGMVACQRCGHRHPPDGPCV